MVKYALTEGFGIVYERIIREWFFNRVMHNFRIKSVLEIPANGSSGFPGINSSYFAQQGCLVTIVNSDKDILKKSRLLWNTLELEVNHVKAGSNEYFPFRNDVFDLVWNYCEIEKSKSPKRLLKEMVRVSKKIILPMIQNSLTYGYFIHRIHHRYLNKPWDHGNPKYMRIKKILQIADEYDLKIVEVGLLDAPPFPDTWELMFFPLSKKKNIKIGIRELRIDRRVPLSVKILYTIETILPWYLKIIFAHHPYIIAQVK
jgi:SAM-dependent methyltransferase